MKNLRELMFDEIKRNGWLDYEFKSQRPGPGLRRRFVDRFLPDAYAAWLGTLSDEEFLAAYNRVRDAERELD